MPLRGQGAETPPAENLGCDITQITGGKTRKSRPFDGSLCLQQMGGRGLASSITGEAELRRASSGFGHTKSRVSDSREAPHLSTV